MTVWPAIRAKVLVLEDQAVLRHSMARAIATLGNVAVREAGTLAEARAALARDLPQLLVSDLQLPDGIGTDLLSDLDRSGLRIPVLFISGFVGAYRHLIPTRIDIEVREKPVPIEELRSLVQDRLAAGGEGVVDAPFALQDYLQLALLGHHSLNLMVEREGRQLGRVVTHQGEIWAARDQHGIGEPAVQRLFVLGTQDPHLRVRCQSWSTDPPLRNVQASAPALLLEAARLLDEGRGHELELPELPASELEPISDRRAEEDFEALFDAGVDALLRKDYREARSAFRAAATLRPTDPLVVANLRRLEALGYPAEEEQTP